MAGIVNKDSLSYQREKQEFIDGLRYFHTSRGTQFDNLPRVEGNEVDLYSLYQKVTSLGGWKKVSEKRGWKKILQDFSYPNACMNAEQSLKYIYIRYLNVFEQINFLGEDPKSTERRDDDGPIRKKLCGPQNNVPLSYNAAQHEIAVNLRGGYGLATTYSRISDYDKLEKALLSGMPNEVDFVINVCTLLSNESKHTLRLDRCTILTDLLLAHIAIFQEGHGSLERLYENQWRKLSDQDFIRFWYDTVENEDARSLLGCQRTDCKKNLVGRGILSLGRDIGISDKEGIRITQVAIIFRNLSFEDNNMKYLANHNLVFRFLLLCTYSKYGTLRQLALDTLGNLSAQFILDPVDSFKSQTILKFIVQSITATDKFSVVTGLEMVSKLARQEDNEYVLSEKLDLYIFEEIAKYLTIQDIQLIVSSLEAMYQLSELGEETNSKIAEVSNSVDTLVSLITVEAQSYGPNSLVGIKVVEYCPPSHLIGGVKDGVPGSVGPPGSESNQESNKTKKNDQKSSKTLPKPPPSSSAMEITTCNWLQATFQQKPGCTMSHMPVYTEYLSFCKNHQLSNALSSQNFQKALKVVFPRSKNTISTETGGSRKMCIEGISRRDDQLPFSIAGQVSRPSCVAPTIPTVSDVRPSNSAIQSPNLIQRLTIPSQKCVVSSQTVPKPTIFPSGVTVRPPDFSGVTGGNIVKPAGTVTIPTYTVSGGIPAQGITPEALQTTQQINTPTTNTSTNQNKPKSKKKSSKKNAPILPRPEQNNPNLSTIVPKITQQPVAQQPATQLVQNIQYSPYPQEIVYQSVDPQNSEAKVMVKTLLAQKIRHGNVIIQQPVQGMVSVDVGGGGDGQTVQYQPSYPQNVQQTTYIQYASPVVSSQQTVQALFQTQTSQVQTFVVQPGDMYVQNPIQPSLSTQMVTQQPMVVNSQQQIITQQPFITPQVVSQTAIIQQPQIVPQTQIIANSSQFQIPQQVNPNISSTINPSQFLVTNQDFINAGGTALGDTSQNINPSGQVTGQIQDVALNSAGIIENPSSTENQSFNQESLQPSSDATQVNLDPNQTNSRMDVSFEEAEIECAVGSIMEEPAESMEVDEEPVMIENDGNECMFEQKFQPKMDEVTEAVYNEGTEAASCDGEVAGALKQDEQNVLPNGYCDGEELDNTEDKKGSIDGEIDAEVDKDNSDAEIIAKFRAETPIVVPLISENGVFEQDFEARMAVENLLKDVEFHITADENGSDENMKLMYSQQGSSESVQANSLQDSESVGESGNETINSESQNTAKKPITQNGLSNSSVSSSKCASSSSLPSSIPTSSCVKSSPTTKSSPNSNHTTHNGITGDNKPLVNGNISSPEHSVPSPNVLDSEQATKLVNGVYSDETIKSDLSKKFTDKVTKMNGVVNHTKIISKTLEAAPDEVSETNCKVQSESVDIKSDKTQDILAQSIIDTGISKSPEDSLDQAISEIKSEGNKANTSDILAQSILENNIQPSDCDIPDTEPTNVATVVKQIIPNSVYGNIMTVQINNNAIPITFSDNALITSSKSSNQINVCNSRHIPTPDASRDNELSCDSSTSSIATSDLNVVVSEKHSSAISSQSKIGLKDGIKSQTSPRSAEAKKSKPKKRSRSKSGGSSSGDSHQVTTPSPAVTPVPAVEFLCEWSHCKQCFDNAKSVYFHVCKDHLKTEYDGYCKWEGCESLVRKRWSLFTHVQDHHCTETSLRLAAQRRLQAVQSGQQVPAPTIPAMVYPNDAATQAIRRFLPKPPYPEFTEGREGPVTKHIRLTSALILRNLAKYSPAGRSLLKKHESVISYACMSAVESSTALANCLYEILQDQQ